MMNKKHLVNANLPCRNVRTHMFIGLINYSDYCRQQYESTEYILAHYIDIIYDAIIIRWILETYNRVVIFFLVMQYCFFFLCSIRLEYSRMFSSELFQIRIAKTCRRAQQRMNLESVSWSPKL